MDVVKCAVCEKELKQTPFSKMWNSGKNSMPSPCLVLAGSNPAAEGNINGDTCHYENKVEIDILIVIYRSAMHREDFKLTPCPARP